MVNEENNKICENCKYFNEYYAIHSAHLSRTRTGYCELNKSQVRKNRVWVFCRDYSCEKWEETEQINEEDLKASVKRLRDSVEKLALVLEVKL